MAEMSASKNLTIEDAALRIDGFVDSVAVGTEQKLPVAFMMRRDRILVDGPDAASYLQGQLSQQVEALAVGETVRSLLLQPQGKVDSWLRVHRRGEHEIWLDLDSGFGSGTLARLERFKLRTDADFTLDTVPVLAVRGPGAHSIAAGIGMATLDASWDGLEGCDIFASDASNTSGPEPLPQAEDALKVLIAELGLDRAPDGFGELLRVRQGVPAMGSELDESTIPAAAGVVEMSVDFTKGCYVGQELVARVDSRGNNTPTNLIRLSAPAGAVIEVGTELFESGSSSSGGDSVGRVTSVAVWPVDQSVVGLGYVKRSVIPPVELVTPDGSPIQARS